MTTDPHDLGELTDDALTARVRIWQRRRGHRYSLDDVATAWFALRAQPDARSCLDLGCGIGSVLLMAADTLPHARHVGVEAQDISFELAQRNVQRNALGDRVEVHHGDLRDAALIDALVQRVTGGAGFQLITGTPPYKPVGTATPSSDSQRAHARMELRGGAPEYVQAAGRALAADGLFVLCAEAGCEPRIADAARQAELAWLTRLDVLPMAGRKGRLFAVHAFARVAAARSWAARLLDEPAALDASFAEPVRLPALVARDEHGGRTQSAVALREFFGLPASPTELPSPAERLRAQRVQVGHAQNAEVQPVISAAGGLSRAKHHTD